MEPCSGFNAALTFFTYYNKEPVLPWGPGAWILPVSPLIKTVEGAGGGEMVSLAGARHV